MNVYSVGMGQLHEALSPGTEIMNELNCMYEPQWIVMETEMEEMQQVCGPMEANDGRGVLADGRADRFYGSDGGRADGTERELPMRAYSIGGGK